MHLLHWSAWRIPTIQWLSEYIDGILALQSKEKWEFDEMEFDLDYARNDLRSIVETLGEYMDWAVVWFLKEDEYYYLWINNLLRENLISEVETTKHLISFIENKKIVQESRVDHRKNVTVLKKFMDWFAE